MALALAVTLSAHAEERSRHPAKQEKSAIATTDDSRPWDSEKGLLPRSMPALARLEGVLYMERESQTCGVNPALGQCPAVTERTIQRVPKVHGS